MTYLQKILFDLHEKTKINEQLFYTLGLTEIECLDQLEKLNKHNPSNTFIVDSCRLCYGNRITHIIADIAELNGLLNYIRSQNYDISLKQELLYIMEVKDIFKSQFYI